jgi:RhoGEF domain
VCVRCAHCVKLTCSFLEDEDLSEASIQIGPFFRKCLPHLVGYTSYLKNYEVIFHELQVRKAKSSEFAEFLIKQMEASQINQPLESLLIMPVQRLPRYEMLIRVGSPVWVCMCCIVFGLLFGLFVCLFVCSVCLCVCVCVCVCVCCVCVCCLHIRMNVCPLVCVCIVCV